MDIETIRPNEMGETESPGQDRAILVGAGERYSKPENEHGADPLEELRLLADTAGAEVVGTLVQSRALLDPTYYIGKGKAQELKEMVQELKATTVIFDHDLTPAQVSNLEELLEVKVIDRSGLILDIFAIRAQTREARTQVELAQLKYLLPRLTRRWTHLSRQAGGIGSRGPGESQLEIDRRRIRDRITNLAEVLKTIEKQRDVSRKSRKTSFKVALVGYTNAGKSTLLNALSGSDVPVEDKLFKTLDSTTRAVRYPNLPEMLISDTVGFIRDLPHHLVASFKSTLSEVRDADVLLHVIDVTNPEWEEQEKVVVKVLDDLGVSSTPTVMVFNKIDRLENPAALKALLARYPGSVGISAASGLNLEQIREQLGVVIKAGRRTITRIFGPEDAQLLSEVYRFATILDTADEDGALRLTFSVTEAIAKRLNLE